MNLFCWFVPSQGYWDGEYFTEERPKALFFTSYVECFESMPNKTYMRQWNCTIVYVKKHDNGRIVHMGAVPDELK